MDWGIGISVNFSPNFLISQKLIYAFYKKLTVLLVLSGILGIGHGEGTASGPSVVPVQEGWAFGFGMD